MSQKEYHLSTIEEKQECDLHQNSPEDKGYRNFLSQAIDPFTHLLPKEASALDFGSGPGPTLHLMLLELGFKADHFDPIYRNDPSLLQKTYDLVTATEVVEHFNSPAHSWRLLSSLVKEKGYLSVMTLFFDKKDGPFETFWVKNVPSHVAFYQRKTLYTLEKECSLEVKSVSDRVVLFKKK